MCTHQGEKKLIKFIIDDLEVFSDDSEEEQIKIMYPLKSF